MSEISRFFGIVIRMYFKDHNPPHFHAAIAGKEVTVRIRPVEVIRGGLPPTALARVLEWARLHQDELLANWHRIQAKGVPARIPPLD